MDFEIGSSVKVVLIDRNWIQYTSSLDQYLGKWGEIKNYDDEIGYQLEFQNGDQFWFHFDWITDDEDAEVEELIPRAPRPADPFDAIRAAGAAAGSKFYISNRSNRIYKHLVNGAKWNVYEDKDGNIVTSEYFTFRRAPAECRNFDWVVPQVAEE